MIVVVVDADAELKSAKSGNSVDFDGVDVRKLRFPSDLLLCLDFSKLVSCFTCGMSSDFRLVSVFVGILGGADFLTPYVSCLPSLVGAGIKDEFSCDFILANGGSDTGLLLGAIESA